jgi:hypothetical protein
VKASSSARNLKVHIGHPLMNENDDRANIHAVLKHLGCGLDLRDFPGTTSHKLALIRTADRRRLITWQKARGRYELTPVGWSELAPRRRFGLASLMVGTAMGATFGAAALGVFWLSADASHRFVAAQSTAPVSRLEKENAAPASRRTDADGGLRNPVPPPQTASAAQVAPADVPHDPVSSVEPGNRADPPKVADRAAPEGPNAVDPSSNVKQVAIKKARRKTVSSRKKDDGAPAWAYADSWQARPPAYSNSGGQGSWYAFR